MIATYTVRKGQSLYDVCLQTYGDLKYLFTKLLPDNAISSINVTGLQGKVFIYDTDFVKDTALFAKNDDENIIYSTEKGVTSLINKSFDTSFNISFN